MRKAGQSIIDIMDTVGTDIQFLSPRPYMQMHSVKPARVTALWTAAHERPDLSDGPDVS